MQTIIQMMNRKASTIKSLLQALMECSDIVRWNFSRIIMSMAGDYRWDELNENGRKIQDQLRNDYDRFINLVRFLRNDLPKSQQAILEASTQRVLNVIEQTGFLFKITKEDYFESALYEIAWQANLISESYPVIDDCCLLLPDKQILMDCPKIDIWKFKEITKFNIILLSTTLDEIDKSNTQKDHGNIKSEILKHAQLGNITKGIPITKHSSVRLIDSIQKKPVDTLPWLDPNNKYDALLASYFEIVRANPHSQVVLLTGDPHLQERAALSHAAQIKPPIYKPESEPANTPPTHTEPGAERSPAVPAKSKRPDKKPNTNKTATTPLPGKPRMIKPKISISSAKPRESKPITPKPKR